MTPFFGLATTADLDKTNERITQLADATQADIDAITATVDQVSTDLATARDNLQAEIDALAANAGTSIDVSALQAAVAPLDDAVNALGQLQPDPPT